MIRRIYLISIINILITNLIAQDDSLSVEPPNLVLNPSFEEFQDRIPCGFYFNYKEFNSAIKNWKTPNLGKPLIFNIRECQPDFFYSSVEDSLIPHSGNAMVSIQTYKGGSNYQQYIQGTLKELLVKGCYYYIEFYVSRNFNAKYASNNLGFCFIDKPSFKNDKGPIEIDPDFRLKEILLTERGEWVKISEIIKAKSNSGYFLIGNFTEYDKTKHKIASQPRANGNSALSTATYFIDDLTVIKVANDFNEKDIDSNLSTQHEPDTICCDTENLINNSQFNDNEMFNDEKNNLVYSPLYWHYNKTHDPHPIYFSTDKFFNHSITQNNAHPDSRKILQGDTLNYIGIPILPKSEYAYTKLKCELEKDCLYELKVNIRLFGYSNCFSDLMVDVAAEHPVYFDSIAQTLTLLTPNMITTEYLRDNWISLSIDFKAKGDEKYIVVGGNHEIDYRKIINENIDKFDGRNEYVREFNLNYLIDNVILKKIDCIKPESLAEKLDSLRIGDTFVLENVYFEFDKAELKSESFPYLDKLADYLDIKRNINIVIIGHTDNIGSESYNKDLSLSRAKVIYEYLINKKIDRSRLDYNGVGSSQPLVIDHPEEGNSANRRVEIKIIK